MNVFSNFGHWTLNKDTTYWSDLAKLCSDEQMLVHFDKKVLPLLQKKPNPIIDFWTSQSQVILTANWISRLSYFKLWTSNSLNLLNISWKQTPTKLLSVKTLYFAASQLLLQFILGCLASYSCVFFRRGPQTCGGTMQNDSNFEMNWTEFDWSRWIKWMGSNASAVWRKWPFPLERWFNAVSGLVWCVLLGSDSDSFSQSQAPLAVCSLSGPPHLLAQSLPVSGKDGLWLPVRF